MSPRSPKIWAGPHDIITNGASMIHRLEAAALGTFFAIALGPGNVKAEPLLGWSDLYDGGAAYIDYCTTLLVDPSGHVVVGGESADGIGGIDQLIRRMERESGYPLWTQRYAAFDGNDMALTGMVWDGQGDLLVGGYIRGCVG